MLVNLGEQLVVSQFGLRRGSAKWAMYCHNGNMPKRSSKDPNEIAAAILAKITGEVEPKPGKNPAAVALGRLGGLKGGKARADSLTAKKRSEIAKKAAVARWRRAR